MTVAFGRRPSPKLVVSLALAGLGLVGGLASGRIDAVALGAGFAVVVIAGLALADEPAVEAGIEVAPTRVVEDQPVRLRVSLMAPRRLERLELAFVVPAGLEVVDGDRVAAVSLSPAAQLHHELVLRPTRWGAYRVGAVALRAADRTGLYRYEAIVDRSELVRVQPGPESVRGLARPAHTRVHIGNQLARAKAHGNEFADVRPFLAGDRVRDVNWRLTARRAELWVNERHPERNTDVVVFLDAFTPAALDRVVRVAAVLVEGYLAERDRVGLVRFGGSLRWIEPGSGRRQRYRLVDALLETTVIESDAERRLSTVPARYLPPRGLVVVVSSLDDERTVLAIGTLASRGTDLVVFEVDPDLPGDADPLAVRLWRQRRAAVRSRLRRRGLPVVELGAGRPLAVAMQEVIAFRRRAGRRAG